MFGEQLSEDEGRPPWIVRALGAWQPRGGWPVLGLAWAAAFSVPAAAITGELIPGLAPTAWLASLGLLLAWWLAGRRISGLAAAAVLALAGVAADLVLGVWVVRFGPLLGQVWRWLAWFAGERTATAPGITYFREQGEALAIYGQRVAWWVDGLLGGRGAPDNLVVIGLAGLLAWGLAAWAGWWVARRGQPFPGLLPTGIVLALQAYWAEDVRWTLLLFLGATTMLLIATHLAWLMAEWEREGVDYSPEIRLDVALTGAALTSLVLVLAPTLPVLTSREFSQAFWQRFEAPYREIEESVSRSFVSVQPARSLVPAGGVAPGGLPRNHLLGGRPELGREIALRAQARGAGSDAALYWRGQTFAHYTGRGWDDAAADEIVLRLAAGEPWNAAGLTATGRPLINQIEMAAGSRAVLYAAGEPIAADRPYLARLRAAGELMALSARDGPARYTVLSQAADPDPAQLQQAGEVYSSTVISLYLQLPAHLDPRLADLAAEWTVGAATPYDRAVAIESALRQLPYTLDVPAPPANREVVAWFLFDLRRGYCDYFASAMVMLARLSGVPARLAIGYAPGDYDETTDTHIVTELSAHSWPELYFPGAGWVRFEPTPAQAVPERTELALGDGELPEERFAAGPVDLETGMAELQASAAVNTAARQRQAVVGWALVALNGLLLISWVTGWWLDRRWMLVPLGVAPEAAGGFQRLARWGARLGRPLRAGDTPREYAAALEETVAHIAGRAPRRRSRLAAATQVVAAAAAQLAAAYERALFGPQDTGAPPVIRPQPWAALQRLWLARCFSRSRPGLR